MFTALFKKCEQAYTGTMTFKFKDPEDPWICMDTVYMGRFFRNDCDWYG